MLPLEPQPNRQQDMRVAIRTPARPWSGKNPGATTGAASTRQPSAGPAVGRSRPAVGPPPQPPSGTSRIAAMSNCSRTVSLTIAPPSASRES
ncbi:hypothetical protein GCM10011578_013060 [Streptomyces fuscichromogenes]|uniref:Uncharacterized protein n=1 Tax=Streptomyces fuscichromogenes TaxID=1324013 RepID=A0A917X958_9ACTN|nr:hypothetical protein GCM10011578_013060 [Streptomyces fuscichromogenes]